MKTVYSVISTPQSSSDVDINKEIDGITTIQITNFIEHIYNTWKLLSPDEIKNTSEFLTEVFF